MLPAGSEVATLRSTQDDAVVFATTTDLVMPPRRLAHVLTKAADGDPVGRDDAISLATEFACFSEQPAYDDRSNPSGRSCNNEFRHVCSVVKTSRENLVVQDWKVMLDFCTS